MKTILIFEPYLQKGHKSLNNRIVSILSKKYKLLIPNPHNYYEVESPNIKYFKVLEFSREGRSRILTRIFCFVNFFIMRLCVLWRNYDYMMVMAYHTPHFKYQFKLMPRKSIFIFEHFNIDRLVDSKEKENYLSFSNKVGHFVFASYMKDYLESLGVDGKNIYVIPHPLTMFGEIDSSIPDTSGKKHILCPGLSNDDQLIKAIVKYERKTHLLETHNVVLTLRSDLGDLQLPKSILLMNGYLTAHEYENLYRRSSGVLVTYPSNYSYRFSGVILNSIGLHKVVFGNNLKIVHHFSERYPNNCRVFYNVEGLFSQLVGDFAFDEKEFERFNEQHSAESILLAFDKIMGD